MKIRVQALTPMLPNFLRIKGSDDKLTLSVAILDDQEAAELWDHWKGAWLEHVRQKRLFAQADKMRATDPKSPLNQCDGCARGLPIENGIHRGKGYDLIACTADRYTDKPSA
jgi:hypothetical protein